MKLFDAIEQTMKLGLTHVTVFESVLSGKFLKSKGRNVDENKEYICLIDMNKRKISVLGENLDK